VSAVMSKNPKQLSWFASQLAVKRGKQRTAGVHWMSAVYHRDKVMKAVVKSAFRYAEPDGSTRKYTPGEEVEGDVAKWVVDNGFGAELKPEKPNPRAEKKVAAKPENKAASVPENKASKQQ
ncbi:MAG: hypothetical protein AAFW47_08425, partial [Pseudomonadota bacterium]